MVIWGFGGIARTLAPLYTALGADVVGVARTPRTDGAFPVVDDVDAVLPTADVLVNILPTAPATDRVVDARRLALLPRKAWLVNVGRGSTVDEDALVDALRGGELAGAALDVTRTEPLPVDSPLWDLPNVILTPHAAGGRPLGAAALIVANARPCGGASRSPTSSTASPSRKSRLAVPKVATRRLGSAPGRGFGPARKITDAADQAGGANSSRAMLSGSRNDSPEP